MLKHMDMRYVFGAGRVARRVLAVALVLLLPGTWAVAQEQGRPAGDTLHLTVDGAIERALKENLGYRATQQKREAARAKRWEKIGGFMPTVMANASYNLQPKKNKMKIPTPIGTQEIEMGNKHTIKAGITATLPLFSMPTIVGYRMSRLEGAIAEEEIVGAEVALREDVRVAFAGLLLAQESYRVMEASVRSARATLENVRRLQGQGMVAEYDLIRAQVQVSNLEPILLQTKSGAETSAMMLKSMLNLPSDQPIVAEGTLRGMADSLQANLLDSSFSLEHNSQLRVMKLQEEKLGSQSGMVKATMYPTLSAMATYGVQGGDDELKIGDYDWQQTTIFGLQLNVPIFFGLTKIKKNQQLKIAQLQISMQREAAEQQVRLGASVARSQMLVARQNMASSQSAVELSARGLEIARARYNAGGGTILQLTDAEMEHTQAALNLNKAIHAYIKAYVDYTKTMGQ